MIPQSMPSMPGGPFGQMGGTPQPLSGKALNAARSALRDQQNAELWALTKYGATPEELAAEKAANAAELENYTGGRSSLTGSGGAFKSARQLLDDVDQFRTDYNLPSQRGSSDAPSVSGFSDALLARGLYNDQTGRTDWGKDTTGRNLVSLINRLQQYGGKSSIPAYMIAPNGNGNAIKPVQGYDNVFRVNRGFDVGNNDKGSFTEYYTKNPDGTYDYTSADRSHQNIVNKKGGLGGLGSLLSMALYLVPGFNTLAPVLQGALVGGTGGLLSGGGLEGALKGAALGGITSGIGDAVGSSLSGLEGTSKFVGPIAEGAAGQAAVNKALEMALKGGASGLTSAAIGGGDPLKSGLMGALSGGLGAYGSQYLPSDLSWAAGPLARTAVSGLVGNRITPQGLGYSLAGGYLNNMMRGVANPTTPVYK